MEGGWRRATALCFTTAALLTPSPSFSAETCPQPLCTVEASPGTVHPSCCIFNVSERFPSQISAAHADENALLMGGRDGALREVTLRSVADAPGGTSFTSTDLSTLQGFDPMNPEIQVIHLDAQGSALAATRGQLFTRKDGLWGWKGSIPDISPGALWAGELSYLLGGREGLFCIDRETLVPKHLRFQRLPGPNIGALEVADNILYLGLWRGGILHLPLEVGADCGGLSPSTPDGVSWAQSPLPFSSRMAVTALLPRADEGLVGLGSGGVLRGIKGSRPFLEPDIRRAPGNGGPRPYDPVVGLHPAPGGSWLVYTDRVLQISLSGKVLGSWDESQGLDISSTLGAISYTHSKWGPVLLVGQSTILPIEAPLNITSPPTENGGDSSNNRAVWLVVFLFALAGVLFFVGRAGDRRRV